MNKQIIVLILTIISSIVGYYTAPTIVENLDIRETIRILMLKGEK